MFRDTAFDPRAPEPPLAADTIDDLGLEFVVLAMAREDPTLERSARAALAAPLTDPAAIAYRQGVLTDCLAHPELVRRMYARAHTVSAEVREAIGGLRISPELVLRGAIEALRIALPTLTWLREVAVGPGRDFESDGFRAFFTDLEEGLDEEFFRDAERQISELRNRRSATYAARVGPLALGTDHVPLAQGSAADSGPRGLFGGRRRGQTYRISSNDEQSRRELSELRVRGLAPVVEAASRASDQVIGFLDSLARELGFYVASLNLADDLAAAGHPTVVPRVSPTPPRGRAARAFVCRDLRDVALALATERPVVGHDVDATGATLIAITGANGGGKSTLLRSIGQAQVMMQAGTVVGAREFASRVAPQILTHFPRAEDESLERGRLDDELFRMVARVDALTPGSLLLCNESFSSTNELEGSEIARQIVRALRERGVRVAYVTHLYELARGWFRDEADDAVFLRAEREDDGTRPFRFTLGEPLSTSYGADLYREVFGD